jgi:NADH-quinone oxidoreductase subunit C/D
MLKCDLLVDSKDLRATLLKLKKDDDFTILLDMTAVDYSKFPDSTP